MAIRALSFDIDGCLFHEKYIYAVTDKHVVTHNKPFLEMLKVENTAFKSVIVFVGSTRQSYALDKFNGDRLDEGAHTPRGSCFPAIKQISNYLEAELDTFLLADIYGDLPDGTSYSRAMNPHQHNEHAEYIHDVTKATILYAQMHKLAMENPDEEIIFDFYDDRDTILEALTIFFSTHSELIPRNVKLRINYYEGEDVVPFEAITGTGMIDINYRKTVKDMATITTQSMGLLYADVLEGQCIFTSDHIKPEHLTNRREMTRLHIQLDRELTIIRKKANELQQNGHRLAANRALELYNTLKSSSSSYFSGQIESNSFRIICDRAINKARHELEKHRGWKQVLGNLALVLATLGIGYAIAGLYNLATTGHFLLFRPKTDSAEKLDQVQNTVNQICVSTG